MVDHNSYAMELNEGSISCHRCAVLKTTLALTIPIVSDWLHDWDGKADITIRLGQLSISPTGNENVI